MMHSGFMAAHKIHVKNLWRCFLSRITKAAVTTGALFRAASDSPGPLGSHNSCAEAANQIGQAHA